MDSPDNQIFTDVVNASPIGIAVENLEGQPLFVNPAFCSMPGFSEEELCSKHFMDFSPPEDAEKDWELFQQLRAGSIDHYQLEKRYFRRDGSLVWGRLSLSLLSSGPSSLVIAMVEDITEQKKAEEARFQHAAIVESSEDAIVSKTLDGIILSWNKGAQRIYGYTEAEAIGKPISVLVPPELAGEENQILERLRAGGRIEHYETVRVTKGGEKINISLSSSPIKDSAGKTVSFCGIARDITERKRHEEALRVSEERLRLAQQAASIGTFDWNIRTGVNIWTPELEAMYGLPPGGFGGTQTAFENLVHPDDRAGVIKLADSFLKTGQPTKGEWRVVWPDGSVHWIAGRWQVFMNESGESSRVIGVNIDVTERKLAEEARFRHAAIVESSEDAIASGTLDGIIVSWNTGAQHMYGYTEAEAVGKPITMLVPPELPDEEHKILEILRSGGHIEHFETVRVTKTGKRVNVSLSISPIKDSSGAIIALSGIARDITERKRHEEALRTSEERLRLAQQAARIGTFERDVQTGRITWVEGLEPLYGLPPGSVEGKTPAFFNDLMHPADRERVAHLIQEALKTGQPTEGDWRAIWPDGSVHWIAGRWQVLMDDSGEPLRVVGVNMDVTERKLAEQALHAQEELLKIFVKNVPAAVAMLDRDMHYLQVSDRWCTDYLSGRAQVLGSSHYELFPDMPERWKEVHRRALGGETLRADEDHWDGQDGPHWARWEVRPWKTPEGTVGGILILAEDITHRKQMEEALTEMTRRFIEAQEQERTRIGRELHDDINQRLAMLAVGLEELEHDPSGFHPRLQEIRKDVIEISHDVQALSHDLHSSKLQYLGVVGGIKSWCREFAERQRIEIDFKSDVPSHLPLEIGVPLFRVVQEALNNAVKHSGAKRIEVQLGADAREVLLTVRDLGKGFDAKAAMEGHGHGLISMRERVRLVNGTIAIDSKPMAGTSIRVHIPLKSEQNSQAQAG